MEAGRLPGGCKVMKAVSRPPVFKTNKLFTPKLSSEIHKYQFKYAFLCGLFILNCLSEVFTVTVPEGCKVGWAGRADGGRARVCNGEREEGRADEPEGSRAAWRGSAAA